MDEVPQLTQNGTVAVAIFVGTLYCFLGYRTLKFIICLTGFLLAGAMAAILAGYAAHGNLIVGGIAGVLGGLCGAAALLFLYRLGIFLLGMLATALAAHMVLLGRPEPWILAAVFGAGVVGGLLAIVLERFIIILATAAIGAWLVVCGLGYFLVGPDFLQIMQEPLELGRDRGIVAACWAVLAVGGTLAQFATNRVKREVREVVVRHE